MKISELLTYATPNKEWTLFGEPITAEEYEEALTWYSTGDAPTWQELKAAEPAIEAEVARKAVEDQRRAAYQTESDPLFFGWQRGDNTEQEWLDAVQAVKDAYPYPEVTE
jgi:hypothetical protein